MERYDRYFRQYGEKELELSRESTRTWITAFVGYIRKDGDMNNTFALMLIIFCVYSARILCVPLWYIPFVPVLSPLYMQHLHWGSTYAHFVAILLHVSSGIICLCSGLAQFSAAVRKNRPLHRWTGRLYLFGGVVCLHSLWQLQGIVGKGLDASPSRLVQCFNVVCIVWWTITTFIAVHFILQKQYVDHKKWMLRSFLTLTTPMLQRTSNVFLSFILYWFVVVYALAIDIASCGSSFQFSQMFEGSGQMWENYFTCLWSSSPQWNSGASMLSLQGFGEIEHLVFGASAWIGLAITMFTAEVGVASVQILEETKSMAISLPSEREMESVNHSKAPQAYAKLSQVDEEDVNDSWL